MATKGDKIYRVRLDPDHCPCQSFRYHGECIHLVKARLMVQVKENNYYRTRLERPFNSWWHSFEALMAHYTWMAHPDAEIDHLANLFINVLFYEGTSTTDPLHWITNDNFCHDPRIVGTVVAILKSKKIIRCVGMEKSARKQCHGRPIGVWELTQAGRDMVEVNGGK